LNQGKLNLTPALEATSKPMVLSFPAQSRVLQNVQITQPMLDQTLEYVLPLLHGCAVADGALAMTLQEARFPLGPTLQRDATCQAQLTLRNLRLAPSGLMATLLEAVGHGGNEIALEKYEMTVACREGRVYPSPVTVKIAGGQIVMDGSVGLDGTLAYKVTLPLSAGLVGKKAAPYFQDITVTVPVTGTIKAPSIDRKALAGEVARQVRAATERAAGDLLKELLYNRKR
jgi:hypothetical protein